MYDNDTVPVLLKKNPHYLDMNTDVFVSEITKCLGFSFKLSRKKEERINGTR